MNLTPEQFQRRGEYIDIIIDNKVALSNDPQFDGVKFEYEPQINQQAKEAHAVMFKLLPPEEYGEDSNAEELYNLITDLGKQWTTEQMKAAMDWIVNNQDGSSQKVLQRNYISSLLPKITWGSVEMEPIFNSNWGFALDEPETLGNTFKLNTRGMATVKIIYE